MHYVKIPNNSLSDGGPCKPHSDLGGGDHQIECLRKSTDAGRIRCTIMVPSQLLHDAEALDVGFDLLHLIVYEQSVRTIP